MSARYVEMTDSRLQVAVRDLEQRIASRYPEASFTLTQGMGDDPDGIYLLVRVDTDEPDDVLDLVSDRLMEIESADTLPLYVLPLRTSERIAREMAERGTSLGATASHAH